jgi:hypothetical protein
MSVDIRDAGLGLCLLYFRLTRFAVDLAALALAAERSRYHRFFFLAG